MGWEDPLEKGKVTHCSILARRLYSPWNCKESDTTEWLSLWASLVAQMITNLPEMQENWIRSLGQEDSPEKGMANTPVFLPGKFHGQRSLVGYNPWCCKESDMTE